MTRYAELQAELNAATLQAARHVIADHSREGIYSFALYTSDGCEYVFATFSTMAGLEQAANAYLTKEHFRQEWGDLPTAMRRLKWNPCDSPYHQTLVSLFETSQNLLDVINSCETSESEEEFLMRCEALDDVFLESLSQVRSSGMFDASVVLNLLRGDQSDEERLENAALLNEKSRVTLLRREYRLACS
jgi:hypothetical protein